VPPSHQILVTPLLAGTEAKRLNVPCPETVTFQLVATVDPGECSWKFDAIPACDRQRDRRKCQHGFSCAAVSNEKYCQQRKNSSENNLELHTLLLTFRQQLLPSSEWRGWLPFAASCRCSEQFVIYMRELIGPLVSVHRLVFFFSNV